MRKKCRSMTTLIFILSFELLFSQGKVVKGVVSDELGPIADINVIVKGTKNGTVTDINGNYSIRANIEDVLVFTHILYKSKEFVVGVKSTIDITLESLSNQLDEVVIYGAYDITKTKAKTNVAAVTVSAETIEDRPNASLIQTLQGQVAGLSIISGSGQPGADSNIILRGIGSVSGNSEPLFIIDGITVDGDNFRSINPNEIASVTTLKDAGATAIYGNRGANGVIIIKTKRGKFNSPLKIKYSGISSFSSLQGQKYDLMNSKEQLELERDFGSGLGFGMSDEEILTLSKEKNTDWEKVFFRTGLSQNHNLSFSIGGESINSFTSFGFFNQEGILKQSDLKRFNVRNNLTGKSKNDKFEYSTSVSINYSKSNEPNRIGSGAINRNYVLGALMSVPYISPSDYIPGEGGSIPVVFENTPLFLLDRLDTYTRYEEELKLLGDVNAKYKFNDNFTFTTRLNSEFNEEQLVRAEHPESFNAILFSPPAGFQDQNVTRTVNFTFVNNVSST